jgi:anti-sigma-K factor RskA
MSRGREHDGALERELAAYALGELDAAQRGRLERMLDDDPQLRARVEILTDAIDAMAELPAEAWDGVPAPPLEPVASPAPEPARAPAIARPVRRRWLTRPAAVGLALAGLAAGLVVGVAVAPSGAPRAPATLAEAQLLPIDGTSPAARGVFRLAADQTARLAVSGLAPTDRGHVYELWLMDSTRDLISVATFRVSASGRADVTLPLPAAPSHFRYLDVSLQPLDGTALHSSHSVLRGSTPTLAG